MNRTLLSLGAALALALPLSACESITPKENPDTIFADRSKRDSIFGPEGLSFNFFGGDKTPPAGDGSGIGVNSFLWRATLDTLSFMPLASADPFGGVVLTDWYAPADTPGERFKVNVYILDRDLRADGLRVSVFRQRQQASAWVDEPVAGDTAVQLENAILTRARQLRVAGQPSS